MLSAQLHSRLLVSCIPSPSVLSALGKVHGCLFHISARRGQSLVKETPTTVTKAKSAKKMLLARFVNTKKTVPIRQVTTLSTSTPPAIGSNSAIDSSRAIISPLITRGTATTGLIPLGEQGGITPDRKSRSNEFKKFKSWSSYAFTSPSPKSTTQIPTLSFPPPKTNISAAPDSLPFLDFRTNDSREVYYTKCDEEADTWLSSLESNRTRMWALDAEWKPYDFDRGAQGRLALIQLGNDKTIYLFHVIHMNKFPSALANILEDKSILKVGINIRNDGTKIRKDWGVGCASLVELGAISIQVQDDLTSQRKVRSMETLTRELLGHAVEKIGSTRMGDWQRPSLSSSQLAYAANDVFVTYEVAERIKQLQKIRPSQNYIVELATILNDGAEVIKARGTLQDRQDNTITTEDIIEEPKSVNRTPKIEIVDTPKSAIETPETVTFLQSDQGATSGLSRIRKKKLSLRPLGPASASKLKTISHTPSPKTINLLNEEPQFSYWSNPVYDHMVQCGSRSVVTIIRTNQRQRKRTYSTTRSLFSDSLMDSATLRNSVSRHVGKTEHENNNHVQGDISVPSSILPDSLEGKDIIERNQAVWLEAGGRDISDEIGSQMVDSDDDWHLRQNQALFQSLMSGPFARDIAQKGESDQN
ncbi:hypothetical protein BGX27_010458 [Mortierella sp. AM989]|nr:hypothetical protein BGX27_010458 [Mortierella sp. AM989]